MFCIPVFVSKGHSQPEASLGRQRLPILAHARRTARNLYLALPALLLLSFQRCKASWRCPLLEDNLHGGVETDSGEPGRRAQCEPGSEQSSCSSWQPFPSASPTQLCGPQKPLRKCRPVHKAPRAPLAPAASCMAPVPQLKLEVHGPPQPLVFWGRLSRKQSFSRCSIPHPSQSSRGAPVSFSFSQTYLQLLLPLPSQPHPSLSSQLLPPGKTLPPIVSSLC